MKDDRHYLGHCIKIMSINSFEVNVSHQKDTNQDSYNDVEEIQFTEIDIPSIPLDEASRNVSDIEQNLKDKFVKCEISGRNSENRLVCIVSHSGAGGY